MLGRLACPFTWKTPVMDAQQMRDITVLNKGRMPMPWNDVIIKVGLTSKCFFPV